MLSVLPETLKVRRLAESCVNHGSSGEGDVFPAETLLSGKNPVPPGSFNTRTRFRDPHNLLTTHGFTNDAFPQFLLKKLIGSFLHQNELDLDQVEVAIGRGVVELRDLNLNVAVFNALVAEAELPLKFVSGTVSRLRAIIPWRNLLSQHCQLELDGLELVLRPSSEVEKKSGGLSAS